MLVSEKNYAVFFISSRSKKTSQPRGLCRGQANRVGGQEGSALARLAAPAPRGATPLAKPAVPTARGAAPRLGELRRCLRGRAPAKPAVLASMGQKGAREKKGGQVPELGSSLLSSGLPVGRGGREEAGDGVWCSREGDRRIE